MRKKFEEGLIKDSGKDSADNDASKFIQKRLRGILARKRVEEIRREEQIFLNMAPKSKLKDEKGDPISRMNEEKDHRKLVQKNYMDFCLCKSKYRISFLSWILQLFPIFQFEKKI